MTQPVKDTSTQNAARPETLSVTSAAYSNDEQSQVKLIADMLDTAGNTVGRNKSPSAQKKAEAYGQLHNAFRNLFKLRGQAFLDGFTCFVSAVNKYPDGIFYLPLVNENLSDFSNQAEREVFMIFINNTVRFARSANKGAFSQTSNIDRLASRMSDPELRSLLRAAFLAE